MSAAQPFSVEEYLRRIQRLESALQRSAFDALIAYSVKNERGPVRYLGGYEPSFGLRDVAFFTVVPGGQPAHALLTNAFWDNPRERTWVSNVVITSDFGNKLVELIPSSARRIGIAGYAFFPTPIFRALQAAFPAARIEDATPLLKEVAKIKSAEEIRLMRRCSEITDAGGRAFLESIREGANEREIKVEVERAIMLAGSDDLWFNFPVFSGPQVAVGVGFMQDRTLARGEQVQVICGAFYKGYHGDLSRVATVGPPSPEVRELMETTAEMYEAMVDTIHAGVPLADVAQAAIAVAQTRSMDEYLYRSPNQAAGNMGHGIGCWYDEYSVDPAASSVLESNMVLNLESMLVRPGVGGAKIGDAVLVEPRGSERLSKLEIRTWGQKSLIM